MTGHSITKAMGAGFLWFILFTIMRLINNFFFIPSEHDETMAIIFAIGTAVIVLVLFLYKEPENK